MYLLAKKMDAYLATLKQALDRLNTEEVLSFFNMLRSARQENRTIFIMGNGGSGATASHFVCDFNKGLSREGQKRFKVVCLNDNVASMLAYANDRSYEDIFVEQLKNFLQPGDLVIGISGSGNSMNVVKAISWANEHSAHTACLVGYDGGKLKQIAEQCIHININDMQVAEDVHMILVHCVMRINATE